MNRFMLAIVVACAFAAACSRDNAPPSSGAGDKAAAPAAAAPANQPASPPGGSATTAAARSPEPGSSSAPTFREVTVPAGTPLTVRLTSAIASDTSKVEDPVTGILAIALTAPDVMVAPAGSKITGSVLEANGSGRVKGRASLAFRFDQVIVRGESHQIQTDRVVRQAAADTKGDLKKGGLGAGAGAVIGGIAGGGKGAAIGGVVGGTGAVVATKGKEVRLAAGDTVTTRLREPLKVLVSTEKK